MRLILALLLLASSTQAVAVTWVELGTVNGRTIYIDTESIKKSGDLAGYSLKNLAVDATFAVSQMEEDCVAKTTRVLRISVYRASGELITEGEVDKPTPTVRMIDSAVCN